MSGTEKIDLIEKIICDLADNFVQGDELVLEDILTDVVSCALDISNKESIEGLEYEIKKCVKSIYLQRGAEDVNSLNQSGRISSYVDPMEEMRNNIIKSGKRRLI